MVVFLHSRSSVLFGLVCVDGVLWCSVRHVLVNFDEIWCPYTSTLIINLMILHCRVFQVEMADVLQAASGSGTF
jgi:hypothetical protein